MKHEAFPCYSHFQSVTEVQGVLKSLCSVSREFIMLQTCFLYVLSFNKMLYKLLHKKRIGTITSPHSGSSSETKIFTSGFYSLIEMDLRPNLFEPQGSGCAENSAPADDSDTR